MLPTEQRSVFVPGIDHGRLTAVANLSRINQDVRILAVNPMQPREDRLQEAADVLLEGGIVALPTETFYGLAVDAFNVDAVARLNRVKHKAADSPSLILLADRAQAEQVADDLPALFVELTALFWPGPLTLVIPANAAVPPTVTGGGTSVAVRVPGLALPRLLARRLGRPITGVSANLHCEPPCRTAAEVVEAFGDEIEMVLDGGATAAGVPSTILDLRGAQPRVLREGLLPVSALHPFLPDLQPS